MVRAMKSLIRIFCPETATVAFQPSPVKSGREKFPRRQRSALHVDLARESICHANRDSLAIVAALVRVDPTSHRAQAGLLFRRRNRLAAAPKVSRQPLSRTS